MLQDLLIDQKSSDLMVAFVDLQELFLIEDSLAIVVDLGLLPFPDELEAVLEQLRQGLPILRQRHPFLESFLVQV